MFKENLDDMERDPSEVIVECFREVVQNSRKMLDEIYEEVGISKFTYWQIIHKGKRPGRLTRNKLIDWIDKQK